MRATTIIGGQISASSEIYPALSPFEMTLIERSDLCSVLSPGPARRTQNRTRLHRRRGAQTCPPLRTHTKSGPRRHLLRAPTFMDIVSPPSHTPQTILFNLQRLSLRVCLKSAGCGWNVKCLLPLPSMACISTMDFASSRLRVSQKVGGHAKTQFSVRWIIFCWNCRTASSEG